MPDPKKKPRAKPVSPSVRLATGVGPPDAFAKGMIDPTSRTVAPNVVGQYQETLALNGPTERLAHKVNNQGDRTLEEGGSLHDPSLPALLVSYYYLEQFLKNRHRYHYRDWVMDSGAFSAHNSGATVDLQEYTDCCKRLTAEDPKLTEVYALDVIGDWRGSLKNTEKMWAQGVQAVPCFHADEPWDVLVGMARDYPKIALGGVALAKSGKKMAWAAQCFARVWPKKIHGFAFGSEKAIMTLPFHSVDATNWEIGPCKFGRWAAFGNAQISVRGSQQNLRAEVEWYLELEQKARTRWRKEMALLEEADARGVRLAYSTGGSGNSAATGFAAPSVRLAAISDSNHGNDNRSAVKASAFRPRKV